MKKIFISILSFILLCPFLVSAKEIVVSNEEEFLDAISSKYEDIIFSKDIVLSNSIIVDYEVNVDGNNKSILYNDNYYGLIFDVRDTGKLVLSNVLIDGKNSWSWKSEEDRLDPYKTNTSDYLNIGDKVLNSDLIDSVGDLSLKNVIIKNFYSSEVDKNFLIKASDNNVILSGIMITNCKGTITNFTNSNIEINDNSVFSNNYVLGNKGGLFQLFKSNLVITSGSFINNIGSVRSGTLFGIVNDSILTLNDGVIKNNLSKYHGSNSTCSLITIESGGGFVMNGGEVSNNVGGLSSFIASRWTNGTSGSGDAGICLNSGIIKNNTTYLDSWKGATVFVRSALKIDSNMKVEGIVVINNTSASLENNGTIVGDLFINDSTATAVNNGTITGNVTLSAGSLVNNGVIMNAYEVNTQIENKGEIKEEYVKTLSSSDTKYVVTFDCNGGKDKNTSYTSLDVLVDKDSVVSSSLVLEKRGHTFDSWYIDEGLTIKYNFDEKVTKNTILYAKYNPNMYKVNWVIDNKTNIEEVAYGSIIKMPDNPVKDGYEFIEWKGFTDDMVMGDEEVTFIAVFEKIKNPNTNIKNPYFIIVIIILISCYSIYLYRKKKFI